MTTKDHAGKHKHTSTIEIRATHIDSLKRGRYKSTLGCMKNAECLRLGGTRTIYTCKGAQYVAIFGGPKALYLSVGF
jgi:hypothetical protein